MSYKDFLGVIALAAVGVGGSWLVFRLDVPLLAPLYEIIWEWGASGRSAVALLQMLCAGAILGLITMLVVGLVLGPIALGGVVLYGMVQERWRGQPDE